MASTQRDLKARAAEEKFRSGLYTCMSSRAWLDLDELIARRRRPTRAASTARPTGGPTGIRFTLAGVHARQPARRGAAARDLAPDDAVKMRSLGLQVAQLIADDGF